MQNKKISKNMWIFLPNKRDFYSRNTRREIFSSSQIISWIVFSNLNQIFRLGFSLEIFIRRSNQHKKTKEKYC